MSLRRALAALVATPVLASAAVFAQPAAPAQAASIAGNNKVVYNYFRAKGLTPAQAAGVTGNFIIESGDPINPRARQSWGAGRGIGQWSVGGRWNKDRNDNLAWYAATHHGNVWNLKTQLDFTWYELNHDSSYGLKKLRATKTASSATLVFMTYFERCGACSSSARVHYANAMLKTYK